MMRLSVLLLALASYAAVALAHDGHSFMRFPYNSVCFTAKDGYAQWNGTLSCPKDLLFKCSPCPAHKNCDDDKHIHPRPCRSQKQNPWEACRTLEHLNNTLPQAPASVNCNENKKYPQPMNRSTIVQRAAGWLANGFIYFYPGYAHCQLETCGEHDVDCPKYTYIPVCNGLVAMAWRAPNSGVNQNAIEIPCKKSEMRPGDAFGLTVPHYWFFRRFINMTAGTMEIWQMGGGFGMTNSRTATWDPSHYKRCWRRKNIVEDM